MIPPQTLLSASLGQTSGIIQGFNEIELSRALGCDVTEAKEAARAAEHLRLLRITRRLNFRCPYCGKDDEFVEAAAPFCSKCRKSIPSGRVPELELIIRPIEAKQFVLQLVGSALEQVGYRASKTDREWSSFIREDDIVAVTVPLGRASIRDYYSVKGWSTGGRTKCIVIAKVFDGEVVDQTIKDPHCVALPLSSLDHSRWPSHLISDLKTRDIALATVSAAERSSGLRGAEDPHPEQECQVLAQIVKDLRKLSVQAGDGSASKQGNEFQRLVVRALNTTCLMTKYLGGPNQVDGIIQLFEPGRNMVFMPLEAKTYDEEKKRFIRVSEIERQLDKYARVMKSSEVCSHGVDVPAYIIIAADFDVAHGESESVIAGLESRHKMKFCFMTVDGLLEWIDGWVNRKVTFISRERIVRFFERHRLIRPKEVSEFFNEIESLPDIHGPLYETIRLLISESGQ